MVPRLLTVLGGFFLGWGAVAFLTGQRKLRKLGSEQKKEQSTIVLVIWLEAIAGNEKKSVSWIFIVEFAEYNIYFNSWHIPKVAGLWSYSYSELEASCRLQTIISIPDQGLGDIILVWGVLRRRLARVRARHGTQILMGRCSRAGPILWKESGLAGSRDLCLVLHLWVFWML